MFCSWSTHNPYPSYFFFKNLMALIIGIDNHFYSRTSFLGSSVEGWQDVFCGCSGYGFSSRFYSPTGKLVIILLQTIFIIIYFLMPLYDIPCNWWSLRVRSHLLGKSYYHHIFYFLVEKGVGMGLLYSKTAENMHLY